MQSTGHTSTQAVSLVSIHGSVMIKGMLASLRFGLYGSCLVACPQSGHRGQNRRIIPCAAVRDATPLPGAHAGLATAYSSGQHIIGLGVTAYPSDSYIDCPKRLALRANEPICSWRHQA